MPDGPEDPTPPAVPGDSFLAAYLGGGLGEFFGVAPGDVEAALRQPRPIDRSGLVAELRRQADTFRAPEASREAIERLAHPEARAVVTGQQAGVLLGPTYTLSKAATAVRLAERLNTPDRPVVPVFWIASQDHDTAEIDHAWLLDNRERLTEVRVDLPDGVPVARQGIPSDALAQLERALERLDVPEAHRVGAIGLLRRSLSGAGDPATWFGRLLAELLGPAGLVIFDPMQPGAATLARPVLAAELAAPGVSVAAVNAAGERLAALGFDPQLGRADDATNLFLETPGAGPGGLPRRDLLRRVDSGASAADRGATESGGEHGRSDAAVRRVPRHDALRTGAAAPRFDHAGHEIGAEDIAERLDADPACLTPAAGLRPVVQDSILPTAVTVVGPGELRYLAQLGGVYAAHGVAMPLIWPRATATVLEPPVRRILGRYELDAATVAADPEAARDAVLLERSGHAEVFRAALDRLEDEQAELARHVREIDPTLERTVEKQVRHVERATRTLRRKSARALAEHDDITKRQFERLEAHLVPNGTPQERILSPFSFFLKFGVDAVVSAFLAMEPSGAHEIDL